MTAGDFMSWISDLPQGWAAPELRRLVPAGIDGVKIGPFGSSLTLDQMTTDGTPVYGQEEVISRDFSSPRRFVGDQKASELQGYSTYPGDVLVTMMGTAGRCAAVPPNTARGIFDSHLLRLRPLSADICPEFLVWVLNDSTTTLSQIAASARGSIMAGLNSAIVKSLRLPLPSLMRQSAIAAFLDHKTTAIDALIAKKERLIELLQEKRQVLITLAVTKGLDPNVRMKDSGVEWLGRVPEHWTISRLAFVSSAIQTGPFGSQLHAEDYVEGGVPVLNPANLLDGRPVPDNTKTVSPENAHRLTRHRVVYGDILIGRRGEMGRCALITREAAGFVCGTGCLRVRLRADRANPRYCSIVLSLEGVARTLSLRSVGSTMENLNSRIVGSVEVPLPPVKEQSAIADAVALIHEEYESMRARLATSVELLREYRQALISAAVTGRIEIPAEEVA